MIACAILALAGAVLVAASVIVQSDKPYDDGAIASQLIGGVLLGGGLIAFTVDYVKSWRTPRS
jgi:hypothetical protein